MGSIYKFGEGQGLEKVIRTDNSDLKYLGFNYIKLPAGESLTLDIKGEEWVLILQKGDFRANVRCESGEGLNDVCGSRESVFYDLPTCVYAPCNSVMEIATEQGMEARIYTARCNESGVATFISSKDAPEDVKGGLNWKRKYRMLFGPVSPTKRLIVGESVSSPGAWIGFPPHKHDEITDDEYPLEEIYSYQVKGPHGAYVLQHMYDPAKGTDEHYTIDGDYYAATMSSGYHPTLVVPGCRFYLLWGLAGDAKIYKLTTDPRFAWLWDAEVLFDEQ